MRSGERPAGSRLSNGGQCCNLYAILSTLFSTFLAGSLAAQSVPVRGVVLDSATGLPLRASVAVYRERELIAQANTDSSGYFELSARIPASLEVKRVGYRPLRLQLSVALRLDSLVIPLRATLTSLDTVRTSATLTSPTLAKTGFYERERRYHGTFWDSTQVNRNHPSTLVQLLRPYLKGCTMIFVDGVAFTRLSDVPIATVAGIEIYPSNASAPMQFFNRIESMRRCGSIVVWRAN